MGYPPFRVHSHLLWLLLARSRSQADSAEKVQGILLSSQTERLILKMNWKVRRHAKYHVLKRAAEFDVTVPENFAGFNAPKDSTPGHKLTPSITTPSAPHPDAVAALANMRAA